MALKNETIREVRERANIVDVIGRRVQLSQRGKRFLGLCPFHSEKTPSFSVSAEKQLYYCFGCHASGDVFTFVKEIEGLDFPSAVREVAREVGYELEPESPAEARKRKKIHALERANEFALAYFETQLWSPNGERARSYLASRGIPEGQARRRRLGFGGPEGGLLAYLDAKNLKVELAQEAGLVAESGRSLFDNRVMFSIVDAGGRIAGFGGRRLGDEGPKYINSREGPLFSKRTLLYGWEVAQDQVRKERRVVLVEGYTDVLALERADVACAVAALGTAFTSDHAEFLARFAEEVVLVLDGDAAGRAAALEAAQRLLATKLKVTAVPLSDGLDPDGFFAAKGKDALRRAVESRVPAVEWFIDQAFAEGAMGIEERVESAAGLAPLMFAMPKGLQRELYTARLAERAGVSVEQLERHLRQFRPKTANKRPEQQLRKGDGAAVGASEPPTPDGPPPWLSDDDRAMARPAEVDLGVSPRPEPNPEKPRLDAVEVSMLRELLLYPELKARYGDLAEYASEAFADLLDELVGESEDPEQIVQKYVSGRDLSKLRVVPRVDDGSGTLQERASKTFDDVWSRLKARYLEATRRSCMEARDDAERRGEDTADLEQQIKDLTRTIRRLKGADHQRR